MTPTLTRSPSPQPVPCEADDSEDDFEKHAEEAIKKAEAEVAECAGMGDRPTTRLRSAGSIRPDSAARSRPPSAHTITPRDDGSRPNSAREFQRGRITPRSYNDELEKEMAHLALVLALTIILLGRN